MKAKTKGIIVICLIIGVFIAIPLIARSQVDYSHQWEEKAKLRDAQYDVIKNAQDIISISNRMIEALEHDMRSIEIKAELGRNETTIEEEEERDILQEMGINIDDIKNEIREKLGRDKPKDIHSFDIDKLATAISIAETGGCTKGTGITCNNCFGLKNGSIAPCKNRTKNNTCIYETKEESFDAFKKIWVEGYGGKFPTYTMALRYTNNHKTAGAWLDTVRSNYYN